MKVIELYNHLQNLINQRKRDFEVIYCTADENEIVEYEILLCEEDEDNKIVLSAVKITEL